MKNNVEDSVVEFEDNMYLYPQSFLSRKYEIIYITREMVRSNVDFNKFCDSISSMGMSTSIYFDRDENKPPKYTQIKVVFKYTCDDAYRRNPNIQIDFMNLLMSSLEPQYVLDIPCGQKRKQYFNG